MSFIHLPAEAPTAAPRLEVVLCNGRRLRPDPGVPAGVVRDLVAVLEGAPC